MGGPLRYLAAAVVGLLLVIYIGVAAHPPSPLETAGLFDEPTVTALYDAASPAVVQLVVTGRTALRLPFHAHGEVSSGSGFLVDKSGYILTNYHVVEGASSVRVRLLDGRTLDARVLGAAQSQDVAVVHVDPAAVAGIAPLSLGTSELVRPGQLAVVLGYPLDLGQTMTVGIVSGVGRTIAPTDGSLLADMVQTDARVGPGSSGGPLLGVGGEVIGIVTAAGLGTAETNAVGFAIPASTVRRLLPRLVQGQDIRPAWLGVTMTDVTGEVARRLELPVDKGAYILDVTPGSPAAMVGLREGADSNGLPGPGGDVVLAADGQAVRTAEDLAAYIGSKLPGDAISLTVRRGKETARVPVTLGERP